MTEITTVRIGMPGTPGTGITEQEKSDLTNSVSDHGSRLTTAEGAITTLEGEMDAVEGRLDDLEEGERFIFVIGDSSNAITTGTKVDIEAPCDGEFQGWALLADQPGDFELEIWKDTYANFPPTDADKITGTTGSQNPRLSSAIKNRSTDLTGWTTAFSQGDILRFHVPSASTVTRVTVALRYNRT